MGTERVLGPDGILIDPWRCLGDEGVSWQTKLFYNSMMVRKCLSGKN